ncbi:MAG: FoF1 ATP synthase subunit gamma [Verrucomicrobiota bacterium]
MALKEQIKKQMQTNNYLDSLLEVLKMIAAAEYRVLEKQKATRHAVFMEAFGAFFHLIDFSAVDHPFRHSRGNLGIIMITSDEGFMGGLNSQVVHKGIEFAERDDDELVIFGERGARLLLPTGRHFVSFPGIKGEGRYEGAVKLKDYIVAEGLANRFGRSVIIYPHAVSFAVQKVETISMLPCDQLFEKKLAAALPAREVIMESAVTDLLGYLIDTWITLILFNVFDDSKLSEFAARTIHLEESHQRLEGQNKILRNQYFRARRAWIDKQMQDMFAGQIGRRKNEASSQESEFRSQN